MQINGIDLEGLTDDKIQTYIPVVDGRVAHIDADFIAYQVAYKEDHSWDEMVHNLQMNVETQKNLCGAEHYVLHLTASGSTKANRHQFARIKPYQETRKDKERPPLLENVRRYMRDEMRARYWRDREADDGMAQANYEACKKPGTRIRSVISSADKDLRMVCGLHLDPKTLSIVDAEGFGNIWLDEDGSSKKVLGWGQKFFWAQMLMGDTADNIGGLPALCPPVLNLMCPTTTSVTDEQKANAGCEKAAARLLNRKPKSVGPVLTMDLLKHVTNNKEAFKLVYALYELYNSKVGFFDYRDQRPLTTTESFMSEGYLLWMQRLHDPCDFRNFIRQECL